jgi:serine/threonine protein kinase
MTTLTPHRPFAHAAGDEPLPGYRLVAPLGRGGFGEVWRCVAPGGLSKAVKFVTDDGPHAAGSLAQEYEAFQRVKGIRHPFLLTLERVELVGGELVMVMELADKSLAHRFDEYRAAGRPGIPRAELLSYMVDTAEALDVLGTEHGLQHLDVKPANLLLVGGHAKVGDYGLVARHLPGSSGGGLHGRGLTPRYVAPEVLDGRLDPRSDQYPLALVYVELLTGAFPYPGPTAAHLLAQHRTAEPNLSALPASDREAVARALAKHPAERFPTCLRFVTDLTGGSAPSTPAPGAHATSTRLPSVTPLVTSPPRAAEGGLTYNPADAVTQRIAPTPVIRLGAVASLTRAPDDLTRACPGYQPSGGLDHGSRGRTGKALDPTGRPVRVCVLRLEGGSTADLESALRMAAIPHPLLWQTVSAPHPRWVGVITPGHLTPLGEWAKQRGESSRPLRPSDVVDLLAPIAGALDDLHQCCRFPHLLVSPLTLQVDGDADRCGLTGFGVGELLRRSRPDFDWLADDPFVAPEAAGKPAPASDQYSLALVFLALVGAYPARRTTGDRVSVNWSVVTAAEQAAVRKALAPNPADRFATCAEFIQAVRPTAPSGVVLPEVRLVEPVSHLAGHPDPSAPPPPAPALLVDAVLGAAQDAGGAPDSGANPLALPDGRLALRFPLKWTPGLGQLKTGAFKDQYGYLSIPMASDTTLLKPMTGKAPVELVVRWPVLATAGMAEVVVTGRYTIGRESARGAEQVAAVLDQFRRCVQNTTDRRRSPRVRADFAVTVYPVTDDLQVRPPIVGRCRDVSATGFAAVFPDEPKTEHVFVSFPGVSGAAAHAVLAKLMRARPEPGGEVLLAGRYVHTGDDR